MKFATLYAAAFVAIPLIGVAIALLIPTLPGFLKVDAALLVAATKLQASATSVELLATTLGLASNNLFAIAPDYIAEIGDLNISLKSVADALAILSANIATINTSPGSNDLSTLPGHLNDIADGLGDLSDELFNLTTTVTDATTELLLQPVVGVNLRRDFVTAYQILLRTSAAVLKTAEAIRKFALIAGNAYVGLVRLAIITNNVIGAVTHAAQASALLGSAIRNKIPFTGTADATLTQTANELDNLSSMLVTTAGALSL